MVGIINFGYEIHMRSLLFFLENTKCKDNVDWCHEINGEKNSEEWCANGMIRKNCAKTCKAC